MPAPQPQPLKPPATQANVCVNFVDSLQPIHVTKFAYKWFDWRTIHMIRFTATTSDLIGAQYNWMFASDWLLKIPHAHRRTRISSSGRTILNWAKYNELQRKQESHPHTLWRIVWNEAPTWYSIHKSILQLERWDISGKWISDVNAQGECLHILHLSKNEVGKVIQNNTFNNFYCVS